MRKGDIVTIKAVVEMVYPNNPDYPSLNDKAKVRVEGHHDAIWVDLAQVTVVTPCFNNGERVRKIHNPEITGTIVATFDGDCWVDLDKGNRGTIKATDLEILPADVVSLAEAA
jgi:hypothetical protein